MAAAQNIDSSRTPLNASSDRNAVRGTIAALADTDWYAVSLTASHENTFVLQSDNPSVPLGFALHRPDGSLVKAGVAHFGAIRIDDVAVNPNGVYYVAVTVGGATSIAEPIGYTLGVTRSAGFDLDVVDVDTNGTLATAKPLGSSHQVGGYVGHYLTSATNTSTNDRPLVDASEWTEMTEGRYIPTSWLDGATTHESEGLTTVTLASAQDPRILMTQPRVSERFVSINSAPEGDFIQDIVYTPDGTRLLMAHRDTQNVLVVNAATGAIEADIALPGQPVDIEISPDGAYALTANSTDNSVTVINLATMTKVADVETSAAWPYRVHVTPDGTKAVVATAEQVYVVLSLATLAEVGSFDTPGIGTSTLQLTIAKSGRFDFEYLDFAITPDSTRIITPAGINTTHSAKIFNIASGAEVASIPVAGYRPTIELNANGTIGYAISRAQSGSTITKFNAVTGAVLNVWTLEALYSDHVQLTPAEDFLMVGGLNQTLFIDLTDGSVAARLNTLGSTAITLSHDGQYAMTRQVIDIATKSIAGNLTLAPYLRYVVASPTEMKVVQATSIVEDLYRYVDLSTIATSGVPTATPFAKSGSAPEGDTPDAIKITPDGLRAITANYDSNNLSIIDLQTDTVLAWIDVGIQADRVVLTPDGNTAVVTSSLDSSLVVVDLVSQTVLKTLTGINSRPYDVLLSSDASEAYVLTASDFLSADRLYFIDLNGASSSIAGSIIVGDAAAGTFRYSRLALSPDGATLAVPASRDDELVLVDTATRTVVDRLATRDYPERAVFSPDGSRLYVLNATSGSISVIHVAGANSEVIGLVNDIDGPYGLVIDDQGRYLYTTSSNNKSVRVVDTETMQEVAAIPIDSVARVAEMLLVDNVLYLVGDEGVPASVPLRDDGGHLIRVLADGPNSRFIDDVLLGGRVRELAYSDVLKTVVVPSYSHDGVDLVDFSSDARGDQDHYRFLPQVGDVMTISATVPGTAAGMFDNELDIAFDVFDPTGKLLAHSNGEAITVTASSIGEYFLRVYAQDLTRGEYTIQVSGVTQVNGPSLVSLSPADNAIDVITNTVVKMTFDQAVVMGTGSISIYRSSNNSLFESIAVSDPRVSINGSTLSITPASNWETNTEYYVLIDSGFVEDSQGDDFGGLSSSQLWNFTIGFGHDFGDAPTPYPVAIADGGPRHSLLGPRLGSTRDGELNGNPSSTARGDDLAGIDDEDGILQSVIRVGAPNAELTVNVTTTGPAYLDAWIDFNRDGIWSLAQEHVARSVAMTNGANILSFEVPGDAYSGESMARFRISSSGGLGVRGGALDGEVEDHVIVFSAPVESSEYFTGYNLLSASGLGHEALATIDLDGDGDTDLVSGKGTTGRLAWFENNGTGTFTERSVNSNTSQSSIYPIDMDGDGDIDIASVQKFGSTVTWFENTGNEIFVDYQIEKFAVGASLNDLVALDYDFDGDIDLTVVDGISDDIFLYLNNGSQYFTRSTLLNQTDMVRASFADADRDGDYDILANGYSNATWFKSTPAGFVATVLRSGITSATDWIDLDNDSDLDIVIGDVNSITWHENDGGIFSAARILYSTTANLSFTSFRGADLDGDGDIDLLSSSAFANTAGWFRNDGEQNFTEMNVLSTISNVYDTIPLDYDRDGDLDVAMVSFQGVGIFENINGVPPVVTSLAPALGATVVDVDTNLTMSFDQHVTAGSGVIQIWNLAANVLVETIDVRSASVSIVENLVSIDPNVTLAPITQYQVRLSPGAFAGLDGDKFPGLFAGTWEFETAGPGIDYGDAPDATAGSAENDYATTAASNGPSHMIVPGLYLGNFVDGDSGTLQNTLAHADDAIGVRNDEDGVLDPQNDLQLMTGTSPTVTIKASNRTARSAVLKGWIDYDGDGLFEESESALVSIPTGTNLARITMTFPMVPEDIVPKTYARFRLGSDTATLSPDGASDAGEVEDYGVTILRPGLGKVIGATKIADAVGGGPTLANSDAYGTSIAAIGDVDGNGVIDIAVGSPGDDAAGSNAGAVYIHLMNADSTILSTQKISGALANFASNNNDNIGIALSTAGDLDFDGILDLIVISRELQFDGSSHVIRMHLNADGTLKNYSTTRVVNGTDRPAINSVARIGDLNGDGTTDFALGSSQYQMNNVTHGAVYVMFTDPNGSAKSFQLISNGIGGGPSLVNNAEFGLSVASLGDINGDNVIDLAVGAGGLSASGTSGTVYIFNMNPDGTVASFQTINGQGANQPPVSSGTRFGSSLTAIGDRNADGVNDLAIGTRFYSNIGKVDLVSLNANGSVKSYSTITGGIAPMPALANFSYFGISVAALGDLNNDGQMDLAVGATGDSGNGSGRGAVYLLKLDDAKLTLTLDTNSISENAGTVNATITRDPESNLSLPLTVTLSSSDTTQVTVPASVTIAANQTTSSPFPIAIIDNAIANGNRSISVRVTAVGFVGDTKSLEITDSENPPTDILLSASSINENVNTTAADLMFATLSASDETVGDTHTFALVSGPGDVNNSAFTIVGNELRVKQNVVIDYEVQPSYAVRIRATDSGGLSVEKQLQLQVNNLVEIGKSDIKINGGNVQRSRIDTVTVEFDTDVILSEGAITVHKRGAGGGEVGTVLSPVLGVASRTFTLTFTGAFTQFGSLAEGNYELRIDATKVVSTQGFGLDTNQDGVTGENFVFGDVETDKFFRLYGDSNGTRNLNLIDFTAFRSGFGKHFGQVGHRSEFDFDQDGLSSLEDFTHFRNRYGTSVPFA